MRLDPSWQLLRILECWTNLFISLQPFQQKSRSDDCFFRRVFRLSEEEKRSLPWRTLSLKVSLYSVTWCWHVWQSIIWMEMDYSYLDTCEWQIHAQSEAQIDVLFMWSIFIFGEKWPFINDFSTWVPWEISKKTIASSWLLWRWTRMAGQLWPKQIKPCTLRKKCWNYVDFPHTLKFLYFPHTIEVDCSSCNLMWLVLLKYNGDFPVQVRERYFRNINIY